MYLCDVQHEMWFRRTELNIGKPLYQVSSFSSGNEPVVFIFRSLDLSWNYQRYVHQPYPSLGDTNSPYHSESQAYDRVHRIGQVISIFLNRS